MALSKGASMPPTSTYHASDGAAYELFLGRWTKVLAPSLLDFAEFPPEGPLLDVGTGTGTQAEEVVQAQELAEDPRAN
jgi:hypothetical protein